jgi:antitoxin component of MazEF toxin-antitoxin module
MIKRLSVLGNSAALIIDKPILELLHITPQTDLEISTDGNVLMILPVRDNSVHEAKLMAAYERVVKRHGKTFEKLARAKQ